MKVLKSTIHKLEIERDCGCKIARDYEDAALKKPRELARFTSCEKHKESGAELIEELLGEVLEKEARETPPPPLPSPVAIPRPPQPPSESAAAPDPNAGAPARTLRTSGSASAGTGGGHRPASAPRPVQASGQHRPVGKTGGSSPFRRADPNANLSAAAISKVASRAAATVPMTMDIDTSVPEDHRVTNLIEGLGILDDGDEGGEE